MTAIQQLELQMRDFLNAPRRQTAILRNKATWAMLCSALDVIGDTELAMEAYLKGCDQSQGTQQRHNHSIETGTLYLNLYGILQVLFVQQDAVQHLAEALGIDYAHDPVLKNVRENRNDAIGHPTKRARGKAFNAISRLTLSRISFELWTWSSDGASEVKTINVPEIITAQRRAISTALTGMLTELREDEMAHRNKFRGTKVADAFPPTLKYSHQMITDSIDGRMPGWFGAGILEELVGYVAKFKEELSRRDALDAYYDITHECDVLEEPIAELLRYLSHPQDSRLNHQDATIVHSLINNRLKELVEMAAAIDNEYSEDV